MKIASISHLFPTQFSPQQGKFIKDQIVLLNNAENIQEASLFVPTPYSVPFTKRSKNNSSDLLTTLPKSKRIKYLSFPKKRHPQIIQKSLSHSFYKELKSDQLDIVHIHFLYPGGLLIPQLKKMGFKTILTIHGSDYYTSIDNPVFKPLIDEIFNCVGKILLVGPQLMADLSKKFPAYQHKYFQINNLVDETIYTKPSAVEKLNIKEKLGWNNDKLHLLCVANNRPEKGLDILANAVSRLSDLESKIQFHIVGKLDDPFREKEIQWNSMIDIIPPVSPSELIRYYHASDGYLSPSRREGFGLSMIEAACTGLPVVANSTGIATTFISNDIGVLNEDFTPSAFEQSIRKLISNMEGFNAGIIRKTVIRNFGKKIFLQNLTLNYSQIITH